MPARRAERPLPLGFYQRIFGFYEKHETKEIMTTKNHSL